MASDRLPWTRALDWTVRLTVLVQCVGFWAHSLTVETDIFELFWIQADLSEIASLLITYGAAWAVLVAGVAALFVRRLSSFYPLAGWFLLSAAAETIMGGQPFFRWAIPAHAVRFVAPVALIWFSAMDQPRPDTPTWGRLERLLQVAVAATFIAHGVEALYTHPRFVDYILMASDRFLGMRFEESAAISILHVIGAVDIVVAFIVLAGRRWRPVLLYMAAWGAIAAASRVVHGGFAQYHEVLIRAANFGLPLALYTMSRARDAPESNGGANGEN